MICHYIMYIYTRFQIEYVFYFVKGNSISFKSRLPSKVDALLCDIVVTKIKESLSLLCDISAHIPELNKKNPFLGNNVFIKGAMASLIHMIVSNSETRT